MSRPRPTWAWRYRSRLPPSNEVGHDGRRRERLPARGAPGIRWGRQASLPRAVVAEARGQRFGPRRSEGAD